MNTKSTAPRKPKQRTTPRSSSSRPKHRSRRPTAIYLEEPRFVFLPYFNTRLRAIIDEGATWYHYEDVMNLPDLEEAARSMHQRQRLVRRVIAKWSPFFERMRKYPVISESDFFRLLHAIKVIDGKDSWDLEELNPHTEKLKTPGGDFDVHDLKSYRSQLDDKQADWRQDKTGSPPMDDWNECA